MKFQAFSRSPAVLALLASVAFAGHAETAPTNKWSLWTGVSGSTPAIAADGTICFGTFGQTFYAVRPDGTLKWTFATRSEIKSSPAIAGDGTIYFGCRDRKLYALTPAGKKKWEFAAGAWVDSSPALGGDGTIYFGSWDRWFYALNPDGSLKWKFQTAGEIDSSPAIGADGTIYFGGHDKKFYALAPDGKKKWEFTAGGQIVSSPALNGEGMVYFTSVDGFLHALNADGTEAWRLKTGGVTVSSPILSDGTLYLGVNHALWAVDALGKKKWEYPVWGMAPTSPTAFADGVVCVIIPHGDLVGVNAEGHPQWSVFLKCHTGASPVVGASGTIYAFGIDSVLNAFEASSPLAPGPWPKFRGNLRNTGNVNDAALH